MAVFYLDTSAVLKRYRTEKGTDIVTQLYEGATPRDVLLTSSFTCLEVESVAARALKGRVLSQHAYDALLGSFSSDLDEYITLLPSSRQNIADEIGAARTYALRPADAVHLAAGKAADAFIKSDEGFMFVASDKELLTAAQAAGMETLNPEGENAMEALLAKRRGQ